MDGYPSDEAYLHGPVTYAQRLTSEAHMSDPRWRDVRPSRPYGGEPGDTPRGRDTRGPDPRRRAGNERGPADEAATRRMPAQTGPTQPVAPQPTFTPRAGETPRRPANGPADGPGKRRGRRAGHRPRSAGGRLSRIWEGSLRGGLGVCVIVGSAVIGAVATIVTKSQPGSVLGLFVLAGTVAAALTVQPRTGRLIFPVPALSYLIAVADCRGGLRPGGGQDGDRRRRGPVDRQRVFRDGAVHPAGRRADHGALVHVAP